MKQHLPTIIIFGIIGLMTVVALMGSKEPVKPPIASQASFNEGVIAGVVAYNLHLEDLKAGRVHPDVLANKGGNAVLNSIFERIRTNNPGAWAKYYP